jgi:Predicted metal-dependent hydrolase of the TIM-barrel fold
MTMTTEPAAGSTTGPLTKSMAYVDADIHPVVGRAELAEYLQSPAHREQYLKYGHRVPAPPETVPRIRNGGFRLDSRPEVGAPGSSLAMMQDQVLDLYGIQHGILIPLQAHSFGVGEPLFSADLCRGLNEATKEIFLDPEPRLHNSICIPHEAPELAADEIRRLADDPRFVQVLLPTSALHPLGERRYWPIYAAAVEAGLPVAIHAGGLPYMGTGWASYYLEEHVIVGNVMAALAMSLILEGVFEEFPTLQVVLVEGGIAWAAPLMWAMDSAFSVLREDNPRLRRLPSEYFRDHYWFTTQPIEETTGKFHLAESLEMTQMTDRIVFSTDYPHWDFDSPALALQHLPADLKHAILHTNGERLYGFNSAQKRGNSK